MTLHWGASHIASCLPEDLAARFHESYADPSLTLDAVTGLPIYNGKTGDLILEMGAEKPMRVSRKKMRNLFCEGIDVQYGKQVVRAYVIEESFHRRIRRRGKFATARKPDNVCKYSWPGVHDNERDKSTDSDA